MAKQNYDIRYKKSVEKELRKLSSSIRQRLIEKIIALGTDPRPSGSVKLRGLADLYRIRYADYRIVYQLNDGSLTILVVKVGHRREIYNEL